MKRVMVKFLRKNERNYSGCVQTVYMGASKVEFEIPNNINII